MEQYYCNAFVSIERNLHICLINLKNKTKQNKKKSHIVRWVPLVRDKYEDAKKKPRIHGNCFSDGIKRRSWNGRGLYNGIITASYQHLYKLANWHTWHFTNIFPVNTHKHTKSDLKFTLTSAIIVIICCSCESIRIIWRNKSAFA